MSQPSLFHADGRPTLDMRGMVRGNDRVGSIEAAAGKLHNIKDVARDRDRVLNLLHDAGENGLTDHCLAYRMSVPGQEPRKQTSVGKRRGELVRDGLVAERLVVDPKTLKLVQELRVPIHGSHSRCGVWVVASFQRDAAGCSG